MIISLLAAGIDTINRLQNAGKAAGYQDVAAKPEDSLIQVITTIINVALSITGVIFLALIVYAGYLYMTANGEKDSLKKSTDIIKRAVIGLLIVVMAYAIANFVVPAVLCATGAGNCPTRELQ